MLVGGREGCEGIRIWCHPPSCLWEAELTATPVQEALLEEQRIFCVLGFHQFLVFNLSVPEPSACLEPQNSWIFTLVSGLDSKLQALKDLVRCGPTPVPQRRGSWCAQHCPTPEKPLYSMHSDARIYVMLSKKLEPGYWPSALDSVPYFLLSQRGHHRDLHLLWQTAKSGGQVVCSLLLSLFSA